MYFPMFSSFAKTVLTVIGYIDSDYKVSMTQIGLFLVDDLKSKNMYKLFGIY